MVSFGLEIYWMRIPGGVMTLPYNGFPVILYP